MMMRVGMRGGDRVSLFFVLRWFLSLSHPHGHPEPFTRKGGHTG